MSFFDESLRGMDPEALRSTIEMMKKDVKQEVADEFYSKDEGEFILAAIENLSTELKGVTSFDNLPVKHKASLLAHLSFIYDVLEKDDEYGDEYEDEEEDFDEEEDEDESPSKRKGQIESFPE